MTGIEEGSEIPDVKTPQIHFCGHDKAILKHTMLNLYFYEREIMYCKQCKVFLSMPKPSGKAFIGVVIDDPQILTIANEALLDYEENERKRIEEAEWKTKW